MVIWIYFNVAGCLPTHQILISFYVHKQDFHLNQVCVNSKHLHHGGLPASLFLKEASSPLLKWLFLQQLLDCLYCTSVC